MFCFPGLQNVLLSRIAKIVKKIAIQDSKKLYIVYPGCKKCSYHGYKKFCYPG
jgi:predicted Zn-ribbon and HTH transcriptional regulator